MRRRNERPIELRFVFLHLGLSYPLTILDVGSGTSSLPHLMSSCGFEVTAIDNTKDYWPRGMFNHHFPIEDDDITDTKLSKRYDFITCVSTLEHIKEHEKAAKNMMSLLNPSGQLIITCPYCETDYVENVYRLSGSGYGQNAPFICQVFSRNEVNKWLEDSNCCIVDQEYWNMFHGRFWTFGKQYYPPIQTSEYEQHQLTCLLIKNKELA